MMVYNSSIVEGKQCATFVLLWYEIFMAKSVKSVEYVIGWKSFDFELLATFKSFLKIGSVCLIMSDQ